MSQLLQMLEGKMQLRARPKFSTESAADVLPSVLQDAAASIAVPSDVPMKRWQTFFRLVLLPVLYSTLLL